MIRITEDQAQEVLVSIECYKYQTGRCFICYGIASNPNVGRVCKPCWEHYSEVCRGHLGRKMVSDHQSPQYSPLGVDLIDISRTLNDEIGYPTEKRVANVIQYGPIKKLTEGDNR